MKLSVIIPFYNEIELISRAVASVNKNVKINLQKEIIICNDGSIPNLEIYHGIDKFHRKHVKIINNSGHKGPGGARNAGLESSTGELIAFLDADDEWLPGKIDSQLNAVVKGATFVATGYRFRGGITLIVPPHTIDNQLEIFLKRGIGTSTVLITRELVSEYRFDNMRFAQDIDFWYNVAGSSRFVYQPVLDCCVLYSTSGSTKNKYQQVCYLNKVLKKNNISAFGKLRVLASYTANGFLKHYLGR
jgi:glycosyltransferase involved in cell wall biosynthesis